MERIAFNPLPQRGIGLHFDELAHFAQISCMGARQVAACTGDQTDGVEGVRLLRIGHSITWRKQ